MSHGRYEAPFVRRWWPRDHRPHVVIRNLQKETQMPSNPNQTPAEPPKFATPAPAPDQFKIDQLASAESLPLPDAPAKPVDEVQQAMQGELSDAADRLDLAAAEDPVLDPIGQNPASAEANGKQADLPAGTAAPVPFDVGD